MTLKGTLFLIKNAIIFYLILAYLFLPLGGDRVLIYLMEVAKKYNVSEWWAIALYYAPFFSAPYWFNRANGKRAKGENSTGEIIEKPKRKPRAPTTRRRKGENDADYLKRIIEKNCPNATEVEVLAWIREHMKIKRISNNT